MFSDQIYWQINQITDAKYSKGKRHYKVKWSDVGNCQYAELFIFLLFKTFLFNHNYFEKIKIRICRIMQFKS